MITLTLLLVLHVTSGTHAIDCYECDHHDHHDSHHLNGVCSIFQCRSNEFCKLRVNQEHGVKGECRSLYGSGHGHHHDELNHCYHEMHHWCHDYRLATFHGECVFCCTTSDCVRQALNLPSPTTPAPVTLPPPTTTPVPTATTIQSATSLACKADCVDLSPDCATTPNVCSIKFGPLVCKKYCGLCSSNTTSATVAASTTTLTTTLAAASTTTAASTSASPTGSVLPLCTDQIKNHNCHLIPDVCNDSLANLLCPEFCGFCRKPSTAIPTTMAVLSNTATTSACTDHAAICLTQNDICLNPLGHQLCPKTCKTCTVGNVPSTSPLPVQTSSTTNLGPTSTSLPAVTTTQPHSHRSCYQCGNMTKNEPCTLAEVALGKPSLCPSGNYCMTDVYNTLDGRMNMYKRCVGKMTCQKQWFDETSDRRSCVNYNSLNKVPDLYCHFCCTSDNCNTNIVPPDTTLFWP